MRHSNNKPQLNRKTDQRAALVRSLVVSLVKHKKISTTLPKAKVLQRDAERLVTIARKGDVASRRLVSSRLGNNAEATKELVDVIAPSYATRPGGYTRVIKNGNRKSDGAPLAIIEFVV